MRGKSSKTVKGLENESCGKKSGWCPEDAELKGDQIQSTAGSSSSVFAGNTARNRESGRISQ